MVEHSWIPVWVQPLTGRLPYLAAYGRKGLDSWPARARGVFVCRSILAAAFPEKLLFLREKIPSSRSGALGSLGRPPGSAGFFS